MLSIPRISRGAHLPWAGESAGCSKTSKNRKAEAPKNQTSRVLNLILSDSPPLKNLAGRSFDPEKESADDASRLYGMTANVFTP
jgi:hypothetical protein